MFNRVGISFVILAGVLSQSAMADLPATAPSSKPVNRSLFGSPILEHSLGKRGRIVVYEIDNTDDTGHITMRSDYFVLIGPNKHDITGIGQWKCGNSTSSVIPAVCTRTLLDAYLPIDGKLFIAYYDEHQRTYECGMAMIGGLPQVLMKVPAIGEKSGEPLQAEIETEPEYVAAPISKKSLDKIMHAEISGSLAEGLSVTLSSDGGDRFTFMWDKQRNGWRFVEPMEKSKRPTTRPAG